MSTRDLRSEHGGSLIMTLAFMVLASALVTGLLSIATTSFKATEGIKDQRKEVYAADGAVEAAIAWFQRASTSELYLLTEHDCYKATVGGLSATVRCKWTQPHSVLGDKRAVTFTGSVNGEDHVVAEVVFLDGGVFPSPVALPTGSCRRTTADAASASTRVPCADIHSWQYIR